MCCVNPWTSLSRTSSELGQIVSSEPSAGGLPETPLPPTDDAGEEFTGNVAREEFDAVPAKRARGAAREEVAGGRDRISDMPDAVLLAVLSHLPLNEAGRTVALSSRWRRLFDDSLLDFDASQPWPPVGGCDSQWVLDAVTSILAARPHARIRTFRVVMYGLGYAGQEAVVDGWLCELARRGVQELDFSMLYASWRQLVPASLLKIASLKTLKASNCIFPNLIATLLPRSPLTCLKALNLSDVNLSDDSLNAFLSYCSALQYIKLKNIIGIGRICIRSKSLKSLLGDFDKLFEIVAEDAPNLEQLVGVHLPRGRVKVTVVQAPKLEVLGYLGMNACPFMLHDSVFDGRNVQLRTLMYSVKTLAVQVPFSVKGYATVVAQWLRCFPCLETLAVEADERSMSRSVIVEEWDTTSSIQCLDGCLRKVLFENFGGMECQWGLLIFLLAMAKDLKVVEFHCLREYDEEWARKQRAMMCIQNRASVDARFMFFRRSMPAISPYLCHCCQEHCKEEDKEFLI